MATNFPPLLKYCLAHFHLKVNMYTKFHLNCFWNAVFHVFGIICRYHGNAHSATIQKCVMHIYTSRSTCVPILIEKCFSPHFWHNMPLTWQHNFLHCRNMWLAQLHPTANVCGKFHFKCYKNVEVVQSAMFSPMFAIICHYHGNARSATVEKCVLRIFTSRQTSEPNSTRIVQNWRSSLRRKFFPKLFAIICRYHSNTLSVQKCILHLYTPRWTSVPNFMTIGQKLRK